MSWSGSGGHSPYTARESNLNDDGRRVMTNTENNPRGWETNLNADGGRSLSNAANNSRGGRGYNGGRHQSGQRSQRNKQRFALSDDQNDTQARESAIKLLKEKAILGSAVLDSFRYGSVRGQITMEKVYNHVSGALVKAPPEAHLEIGFIKQNVVFDISKVPSKHKMDVVVWMVCEVGVPLKHWYEAVRRRRNRVRAAEQTEDQDSLPRSYTVLRLIFDPEYFPARKIDLGPCRVKDIDIVTEDGHLGGLIDKIDIKPGSLATRERVPVAEHACGCAFYEVPTMAEDAMMVAISARVKARQEKPLGRLELRLKTVNRIRTMQMRYKFVRGELPLTELKKLVEQAPFQVLGRSWGWRSNSKQITAWQRLKQKRDTDTNVSGGVFRLMRGLDSTKVRVITVELRESATRRLWSFSGGLHCAREYPTLCNAVHTAFVHDSTGWDNISLWVECYDFALAADILKNTDFLSKLAMAPLAGEPSLYISSASGDSRDREYAPSEASTIGEEDMDPVLEYMRSHDETIQMLYEEGRLSKEVMQKIRETQDGRADMWYALHSDTESVEYQTVTRQIEEVLEGGSMQLEVSVAGASNAGAEHRNAEDDVGDLRLPTSQPLSTVPAGNVALGESQDSDQRLHDQMDLRMLDLQQQMEKNFAARTAELQNTIQTQNDQILQQSAQLAALFQYMTAAGVDFPQSSVPTSVQSVQHAVTPTDTVELASMTSTSDLSMSLGQGSHQHHQQPSTLAQCATDVVPVVHPGVTRMETDNVGAITVQPQPTPNHVLTSAEMVEELRHEMADESLALDSDDGEVDGQLRDSAEAKRMKSVLEGPPEQHQQIPGHTGLSVRPMDEDHG